MEKHKANDSHRSKAKKDKSNLKNKNIKSPDLSSKKRVPVYMETMYGKKFSHYKFI